jgi:hypothetical protein
MLIDAENFEKNILSKGLKFMDNATEDYFKDISAELKIFMRANLVNNISSRMDIYDEKGNPINTAADSFLYFITKRYQNAFPNVELLEKLSLINDIKEPGCQFSSYLNYSETKTALEVINEIIKIEKKYIIQLQIVKMWFEEAIRNKMGVIYFFA